MSIERSVYSYDGKVLAKESKKLELPKDHLMLPSEAIDEFEAFDQLFPAVEEKLKQKASEKGADGIVGVRFTTNVANVQVAPKFLVLTGYGTMVQLLNQKN